MPREEQRENPPSRDGFTPRVRLTVQRTREGVILINLSSCLKLLERICSSISVSTLPDINIGGAGTYLLEDVGEYLRARAVGADGAAEGAGQVRRRVLDLATVGARLHLLRRTPAHTQSGRATGVGENEWRVP